MKKSYSLILDNEFIKFCELNEIKDINKTATETFQRGFSILKYGETPTSLKGNDIIKEVVKEIIKEVPVEVIKEFRVEVPVEVIKEVVVEKIVEVVVEKNIYVTDDGKTNKLVKKIEDLEKELKIKPKEVIKEVVVEKTVHVADDEKLKKLEEENKKLTEDLEKIVSSLNGMSKAKFMKNSNMNSLYGE